jgi:hypothetical protein
MQMEMLFVERMAGNKKMFVNLINHDVCRDLAAGLNLSAGDGNGRVVGIADDGWREKTVGWARGGRREHPNKKRVRQDMSNPLLFWPHRLNDQPQTSAITKSIRFIFGFGGFDGCVGKKVFSELWHGVAPLTGREVNG